MNMYTVKAKRTDNSKWVCGMLARYNPEHEVANIVDEHDILIPVQTKTIERYIGLKDKNNKEIFTGDIIRYYVKYLKDNDATVYDMCNVYYSQSQARFLMISKLFQDAQWSLCDTYKDLYEVIGNIHDNPELLNETTDLDYHDKNKIWFNNVRRN